MRPRRSRSRARRARTCVRSCWKRPRRCASIVSRRTWTASAPTLVLLGTRDDVVAPAVGRIYKERIPNAHLVFVYDAGHAISADRPEAFTEVVADFLERHEAFVISRTPTVIHP